MTTLAEQHHRGLRSWFATIRLMVTISLRADRARSIGALATASAQLATRPLLVIGMAGIADGIATGSVAHAERGAVLLVAFGTLNRLATHASMNLRMRLREHTQLYLDTHLMELTASIPGLEHHERPEYLDEVELLRGERGALANPFNPISWSVGSIVETITVVVLLARIHPLLVLLPIAGIPGAWAATTIETGYIKIDERQAARWRFARHLLEVTTEAPTALEIRLYRLSQHLRRRRTDVFDELEAEKVRFALHHVRLHVLGLVCFAAAFAGSVLGVTHLVSEGRAEVGAVVLLLGIGAQIDVALREASFNLAWFARTHRAVRRLRWFTDYADARHAELRPSTPAAMPAQMVDGIRFEGVGFTYPGTSRAVLEGVDLHVPAGTTVAIVGENGAGKTTLVKLLCRFYEPTAGHITVDGLPLADVPIDEWRSRVAAGFQDFARFELFAREAVGVGDLAQDLHDDEALFGGLDRAGGRDVVGALPSGFDTQLGRRFDGGIDLSIGQWQKLALGRAMLRDEPLVLALDEPTASLDATTEHVLFERFHGAAREVAQRTGGITILVSHRFSTVRMADLILVVADGRIAEAGSHPDLMALGGRYAELYGLQARSYT